MIITLRYLTYNDLLKDPLFIKSSLDAQVNMHFGHLRIGEIRPYYYATAGKFKYAIWVLKLGTINYEYFNEPDDAENIKMLRNL